MSRSGNTFAAVLALLAVIALPVWASVVTRAQRQPVAEDLGISGYVLGPAGTPVTSGTVVMQSAGTRATTTIEPDGRFVSLLLLRVVTN